MNRSPRALFAAVLACAVLAASARAEDFSGRWGAGVNGGFAAGDGAQAVDDTSGNGSALGVSVLRGLTPHWRAGLDYENMQFGQIRFQPAMLSATYAVAPDQFLTPLVQVGGGVGRADHLTNGGGGETSIAFKGAVGLEFAFTPSFTASTLATLYNSGHTAGSIGHQINGAVLSAGLSLWFGAPQPRYVMYSQPAALPMPAPAPAPAPAAPAPLPKPVPAPAAPQRRAPKTVTIRLDVRFETGKSIVREAFAGNLAEVGAFLQAHPATTAVIEGHSDSSGPETVNTRLSLRRAENVRLYLIGHFRIDGARLTAKGYGPSRPIADNGTEEGRALNRRVVAVLQAQE